MMKRFKKIFSFVLAIMALLSFAGCQKQQVIDYQSMIDSFVSDSNNTYELTVGEAHKPHAAVWLESGTGTVYTDNDQVITVSKYGKVTAVGEGHAHVVITADQTGTQFEVFRYDVYAPVPVADLSNLPDLISGINLRHEIENFHATPLNSVELKIDEQYTPPASLMAQYGTCYSTDESVVTVEKNGNVSAVGRGTAYVVYESGISDSYQIYQYLVK